MQNTNLKQRVNTILSDVWEGMNPDKLADHYHQDVIAYVGDTSVGFAKIKQRCELNKAHYQSLETTIEDIVEEDNRVAFRAHQVFTSKDDQSTEEHDLVGIYHFEDDKVKTVWLYLNQPFQYL